MKYGWELTDSERRREWYSVIKLGKDVSTQTNILKKQSKEMFATQAASANAIIASQDSLQENIENLTYSIEEGMNGLKAAFEFGISDVVWQIEQNRQVLKNILSVLMAPLDTQAKELRYRAEDAYANGWLEDALQDFLESEKTNRYDFSVHISIGMIYLFHKADKTKALEYFEKAVKYARPKSAYHTSLALLHAALIKRDMELIPEAEKLAAEAVETSPDFAEAYFQDGLYCILLGNLDKGIAMFKSAIDLDKFYSLKIANTDELRTQADYILKKILEEYRNISKAALKDIVNQWNFMREINRRCKANSMIKVFELAKDDDSEVFSVGQIESANNIFDMIDIYHSIVRCHGDIDVALNQVSERSRIYKSQVQDLPTALERNITKRDEIRRTLSSLQRSLFKGAETRRKIQSCEEDLRQTEDFMSKAPERIEICKDVIDYIDKVQKKSLNQ